jgi:hypothetical protein
VTVTNKMPESIQAVHIPAKESKNVNKQAGTMPPKVATR